MSAEVDDKDKFYGDARKYWSETPATVDGMLAGLSQISSIDISGSRKFLNHFISGPQDKVPKGRALDCGAGIGRITKRLLLPVFEAVDLVEQNPAFVEEARSYIGDGSERVERFICSGLQDFSPDRARYDLIWCQWVLGHLTDEDLVQFFTRCKQGLTENGVVIIKENVSQDEIDFDVKDSCFVRTRQLFIDLAKKAGLRLVRDEKQKNFPKDLYGVWMIAFQ